MNYVDKSLYRLLLLCGDRKINEIDGFMRFMLSFLIHILLYFSFIKEMGAIIHVLFAAGLECRRTDLIGCFGCGSCSCCILGFGLFRNLKLCCRSSLELCISEIFKLMLFCHKNYPPSHLFS